MAHRALNMHGRLMRALAGPGLAFALSSTALPALAISGDEVSRALGKESEITVHLRSYYFNRDRPSPQNDSEAWALGGWLGYQSLGRGFPARGRGRLYLAAPLCAR